MQNPNDRYSSYEETFGLADHCTCDHGDSVLSAAAYYVDLMRMRDEQLIEDPDAAEYSLKARRSDLWDIKLDRQNTETPIPYLDVVNDVLERQLDDTPGTPLSRAQRYQKLRDAHYPFSLPFNLFYHQIRTFLRHLQVDANDLYQIYLIDDQFDIGKQGQLYLGLSDELYGIITSQTTTMGGDLLGYYGFQITDAEIPNFRPFDIGTDSTTCGNLAVTRNFLQVTDLTFDELPDFLYGNLSEVEIERALAASFYLNHDARTAKADNYLQSEDGELSLTKPSGAPRSLSTASVAVEYLDRIHRIIRLNRELEWSYAEFYQACESLKIVNLDVTAVTHLAQLKYWKDTLEQPIDALCSLWSNVPTRGIGSDSILSSETLFDKTFNNRLVLDYGTYLPYEPDNAEYVQAGPLKTWKWLDDLYDPRFRGKYIEKGTDFADLKVRLMAGLRVKESDLQLIHDKLWPDPTNVDFSLNLGNLSLLYRFAKLPAMLGMKIGDFFGLLDLLEKLQENYKDLASSFPLRFPNPALKLTPYATLSTNQPENTLALLDLLYQLSSWLKNAKLSVASLSFMCTGMKAQPQASSDPSWITLLKEIKSQFEGSIVIPPFFENLGWPRFTASFLFRFLRDEKIISNGGVVLKGTSALDEFEKRIAPSQSPWHTVNAERRNLKTHNTTPKAASAKQISTLMEKAGFSEILYYNGTSAYLDLAAEGQIHPEDPIESTIECWVMPEEIRDTYVFCAAGAGDLFSSFAGTTLQIRGSDGKVRCQLLQSHFDFVSKTAVRKSTWSHIAFSMKKVGKGSVVSFFINGKQEVVQKTSDGPMRFEFPSQAKICLGAGKEKKGASLSGFFKGSIAELRLWKTARSESEIQAAMYSQLTGWEEDLIVYSPGFPEDTIVRRIRFQDAMGKIKALAPDQRDRGATIPATLANHYGLSPGQAATLARNIFEQSKKNQKYYQKKYPTTNTTLYENLTTFLVDPLWAPQDVMGIPPFGTDEAALEKDGRLAEFFRIFEQGTSIVSTLGLDDAQTEAVLTYDNRARFGLSRDLTYEKQGCVPLYTLSNLKSIYDFHSLSKIYGDEEHSLAAYMSSSLQDDPLSRLLAETIGWDGKEIASLQALKIGDISSFETVRDLDRMFRLAAKCGLRPTTVKDQVWSHAWGNPTNVEEAAATLFAQVNARLDVKSRELIHEDLNLRKRDALVPFTIHKIQKTIPEITDAAHLYEFLLIDVLMGKEVKTSRVKNAAATLQLYVDRCLLGLEEHVTVVDRDQLRQKWEWMKNYRVWEANRKVFLHPENYIEPELRDTKTPQFRDFEDAILKEEINLENVSKAYRTYMDAFMEIANLRITGACAYRDPQNALARVVVLFGRTTQQPQHYYCREVRFTYHHDIDEETISWEPWIKLEVKLDAEEVFPIYAYGKIFVFWLNRHESIYKDGEGDKAANRKHTSLTVSYTYSDFNKRWVAPHELTVIDLNQGVDPVQKPVGDGPPPWTADEWQKMDSDKAPFYYQWTGKIAPALNPAGRLELSVFASAVVPEWPAFASGKLYKIELTSDLSLSGDVSPLVGVNFHNRYNDYFSMYTGFLYSIGHDSHITFFSPALFRGLLEKWVIVNPAAGGFFLCKPKVGASDRFQMIRLSTRTADPLSKILHAHGVDGLLTVRAQSNTPELPTFNDNSYAENINYSYQSLDLPQNFGHLDFQGAYGKYYWEIFFHGPFLIANSLNTSQRFEESRKWYEYIVDPASGAEEVWNFYPFRLPSASLMDQVEEVARRDDIRLCPAGMSSSGENLGPKWLLAEDRKAFCCGAGRRYYIDSKLKGKAYKALTAEFFVFVEKCPRATQIFQLGELSIWLQQSPDRFWVHDGISVSKATDSPDIFLNRWVRVLVTKTEHKKAMVYFDDAEAEASSDRNICLEHLKIFDDYQLDKYVDVNIRDLKIWSEGISEISQRPDDANLVHHFPLDEGWGNKILDCQSGEWLIRTKGRDKYPNQFTGWRSVKEGTDLPNVPQVQGTVMDPEEYLSGTGARLGFSKDDESQNAISVEFWVGVEEVEGLHQNLWVNKVANGPPQTPESRI